MSTGKPKRINEATGDSMSSGRYTIPLSPGVRIFKKKELEPYINSVSKFNDAELAYDSYDGKLDVSKKTAKKIEDKAMKISKFIEKHPSGNDDDGDILNQGSKGLDKLNEDLAVWFGTKKKPKGSKQPKGPWVNICRRDENGKHPPCGRPSATDKGYPKCRAAGVAGKMSDAQKRAACQQKRTAEKTHSKAGTGNAPKMVHYEPKKKKNESFKEKLINILIETISKRD